LVSDIPAGDGNVANLFLRCILGSISLHGSLAKERLKELPKDGGRLVVIAEGGGWSQIRRQLKNLRPYSVLSAVYVDDLPWQVFWKVDDI
jgi:hypothetical protein